MGAGATDAAQVVVGGAIGVSLLLALLRRWWGQQDNAFAADQNARAEERASCDEQIRQMREHHDAEIAQLRMVADRRFMAMAAALTEIVGQIQDDTARAKIAEVLLRLSIEEGN